MFGWIKKLREEQRRREERYDLTKPIVQYIELAKGIDQSWLDLEYLMAPPGMSAVDAMSNEELSALGAELSRQTGRLKSLRGELEARLRSAAQGYVYELRVKGQYSTAQYILRKQGDTLCQRDRELLALTDILFAYRYIDDWDLRDVYRGVLTQAQPFERGIVYADRIENAAEVMDRDWFDQLMERRTLDQAYANAKHYMQRAFKNSPNSRRLKRLRREFDDKGIPLY